MGRMLALEAKRMGYRVSILDPTPDSPAGQVADEQMIASFSDKQAIKRFIADCAVTTFEFEHIDSDMLIALEREGYHIYPSGKTLSRIQDKLIQKTILKEAGIPVPDFFPVKDHHDVSNHIDAAGLPIVLKARLGGYDGKGVCVIRTEDEIEQHLEKYKGYPLMAENYIEFDRELSIVVARDQHKRCVIYPIAENIHLDSILRLTRVPANITSATEKRIRDIALRLIEVLDDCGVYCIEMFLTGDGDIYVNEIAPRPHNSGHYTVEACVTSQFEQLVRIITGMPMGSSQLRSPCVMANILGNNSVDGKYRIEGLDDVLNEDDVHFHLYGKSHTKKMRKIGHITALDSSVEAAEKKALRALEKIIIKPF